MAIQAINQQLHFFTNKLHAGGIYILTEIASIKAPTCLEDFDTYSYYLDDLAAVFNCYKDNCIPLPRDETRAMYMKRRPTLYDEEFGSLSAPKSNKRKSVTMPSPN